MLLNSLAINEYKVLKKDALVGKIQRKQSLDRKHACDERESAPSPHSHTRPRMGWLIRYRNAGLFFRPLMCPSASPWPDGPVGFSKQGAEWHQLMQPPCSRIVLTPRLCPLGMAFPAQRPQYRALLYENLKRTQVRNFWEFLRKNPAVEEGENCQL